MSDTPIDLEEARFQRFKSTAPRCSECLQPMEEGYTEDSWSCDNCQITINPHCVFGLLPEEREALVRERRSKPPARIYDFQKAKKRREEEAE